MKSLSKRAVVYGLVILVGLLSALPNVLPENLRLTPDKPLLQLLNESITSTLTRTVFTSVTTFLALLPMAIAGGSAVASFALPMLFGIVIGTSSSVFIAAPIILGLGQRRLRNGLSQLRPTAEERRRELELIP